MTIKAAEKRLTDQLARKLSPKGFMRKTPYLIARAWGEGEAQIRCAARKDKASGKLLVTLMLGIRFDRIEASLGRTDDPERPTIVTPIYTLHHDRRSAEWDVDDPETVEALADEIARYGISFFDRYSQIRVLQSTLEKNARPFDFWMIPEDRIQALAAILILKDKRDAAVALIDREIAQKERSSRPRDISARLWLEKLRKKLAATDDVGWHRSH